MVIFAQDVNDNKPMFTLSQYEIIIDENTPIGSIIKQGFRVTDADILVRNILKLKIFFCCSLIVLSKTNYFGIFCSPVLFTLGFYLIVKQTQILDLLFNEASTFTSKFNFFFHILSKKSIFAFDFVFSHQVAVLIYSFLSSLTITSLISPWLMLMIILQLNQLLDILVWKLLWIMKEEMNLTSL